jgi:xanthine dehydrogenase YagR molybdenum-binding subunit
MSFVSRGVSFGFKAATKLAQLIPNPSRDPIAWEGGELGHPADLLDGPAKAAGEIRYTADNEIANVTYAVPVGSTIATGRIRKIETSEAAASPGVLLVMTHENAPKMKATAAYATLRNPLVPAAMSLPILNTNQVYWNGQPIALIVAETLKQAEHAATLLRVHYTPTKAALSMEAEKARAFVPSHSLIGESDIEIGDADAALRTAPVVIQNVYRTPQVNHSAMELHATIAVWEGGNLTVYDSTQYPYGVKELLALKFGLPKDRVRVLAPFIGGGFGGKSTAWPHVSLAAAAAKLVKRPVKLVLSRPNTFYMTGGRSPTESHVALGADATGRLTAVAHHSLAMCTRDVLSEAAIAPTRHLYASPNISLQQRVVRLDRIQNTFFRGPGDASGSFAIESAMDELAWALKMDPLELRLRNEPDHDPVRGTAFSSRYLRECYAMGAEAFGWSRRVSATRATRDGPWFTGFGMAAATLPTILFSAEVRLQLTADGSVTIECSTSELGAGTSTAQTRAAAQRLGVPFAKVRFLHGDSGMGKTRLAGASASTASIGAAVWSARDNLVRELLALVHHTDSPLAVARFADVETRDEGLFLKERPTEGETYRDILARAARTSLKVVGRSRLPYQTFKYSMHAYGAHFCEVKVNDITGEVRVARWVGAFDGGRIINPKQAQSQLRGGIIMGIGMALMEETLLDERSGRIFNPTLAGYHTPTIADVPELDVRFVDRRDPFTALGAKGIGELGTIGAAAAIANAIYHAIGSRIRVLPITLEKLL